MAPLADWLPKQKSMSDRKGRGEQSQLKGPNNFQIYILKAQDIIFTFSSIAGEEF